MTVSVIAGEAMGARAVIETRTPIIYLHYKIEREAPSLKVCVGL